MGASGCGQRVWVVGNSGSGKSTLAGELARRQGSLHTELDAIFHQPGWTPLPEDEFRCRVGEVTAGERWVVDGNYLAVADLIWSRADTVVWIDLPRRVVMWRLLLRTASRGARRTELWNGNRERLGNFFTLDPQRSVLVWAWTHHETYRRRYQDAMDGGAWPGVRFVRLTSAAAVARFVAGGV